MENKEIIIAITIIAVLAYFYWQNRQESLNTLSPENDTKLKDLQNQVQHYQKLYQQKLTDLETSLLNLAKQKLKGKKEAERLLTYLEIKQEYEKRKDKNLEELPPALSKNEKKKNKNEVFYPFYSLKK